MLTVKFILMFAQTVEIEYGVPYVAARTNAIAEDIQVSNVLNSVCKTFSQKVSMEEETWENLSFSCSFIDSG